MRFSLANVGYTLLIAGLVCALVTNWVRLSKLQADYLFLKNKHGTVAFGTSLTLDGLETHERKMVEDKIQHVALDVLLRPKFADVFDVLYPQTRLHFGWTNDCVTIYTEQSLGNHDGTLEFLVIQFRSELYSEIQKIEGPK